MAYTVQFEVEASRIESHFGVTLFIRDADEEPEDGEEVNCYFLVFQGPDCEPDEAARKFGACHQEAMDVVGLEGIVTEEAFSEKLDSSVELAGDLMMKYGFKVLDTDNVDKTLMATLFFEAEDPETDPKLLN
jgi:hypothetical protein